MQIEDFVKVYQAKSDEELIQLAVAPEQLTSDARVALYGELSRRRISVAEDSGASQNNGGEHDSGKTATGGLQEIDRQGVGDFVTEALRTYHSRFWLYFQITAPAVIITTMVLTIAHNEVREIARHLPRDFRLVAHQTEILEMSLINFSVPIVSWIAFYFVFGAICIAVEESAAGCTPSVRRSFLNLRERLGPFLRLSLVLCVLVLGAEGASALLAIGVLWVLRQWQVHATGLLIWVAFYGLAGLAILVVSRLFLSVPAVILDDCSVGQALFRSDKLTEGKWLTLAALLAKCAVGGYVAAKCPFWLASFVRVSVPLPSWFPWILTSASMIGVTIVEPTMFIGFALLYLKTSALDSAPNRAHASQLT